MPEPTAGHAAGAVAADRSNGLLSELHAARVARASVIQQVTVHGVGNGVEVAVVEQHGIQLGSSLWHSVRRWDQSAFLVHIWLLLGLDAFIRRPPQIEMLCCQALPLCKYLAANTQLFAGKRVLELGCGVGSCGITCALAGASEVTLTDKPEVCVHAEQNVAQNAMRSNGEGSASMCGVVVSPLLWGAPLVAAVAAAAPYDLLIASECVYQTELLPLLLRAIEQLSGPETTALLSFCQRGGIDLAGAIAMLKCAFHIEEELVVPLVGTAQAGAADSGVSDTSCAYIFRVRPRAPS